MLDDILHLDFETCNNIDLRQVGADVYARSPDLIVTVLAWAWNNERVHSFVLPRTLPDGIIAHLERGGKFKCWNAGFESAILTHHYGIALRPEQAVDTMQAALHSGLPGKLEDAGPAAGAKITKDAQAHRLMLQMSKPRDPKGPTYWHDEPKPVKALGSRTRIDALRAYCERDVESEREIDRLIAPLPPREEAIALIDRKANARGVRLDLDLVRKLKAIAVQETDRLNAETKVLTNGAVSNAGTQTARLLAWFQANALPGLPDLSKESITLALAGPGQHPHATARMLEIRQEIAKSSTRKLDAMLRCAGPGDRVRGQVQYYGAPRTGRWAGRLIQPQNFPRPPKADVELFIRLVKAGTPIEALRFFFAPTLMDMVAASLRGCFIPAPGNAFVIYDLEQIEARVLPWLADDQEILDVFARGDDVYVWTAKGMGLINPDGSVNRQGGKVARLALGFQMGAARLIETARTYGIAFDIVQAQAFVDAFRQRSGKIVSFWYALDRAAKALLAARNDVEVQVNRLISLRRSRDRKGRPLMTMLLPSGRRLYYRNARVVPDPKVQGRTTILYDGVHPETKQWGTLKTYGGKLAENATQAVARDIMAEGLIAADNAALALVLTVHDEAIFEVLDSFAGVASKAVHHAMTAMPQWAAGLPVAAGGGIRTRYGK